MIRRRRQSSSKRNRSVSLPPDVLAFTTRQLFGVLPLGRYALYALARKIGIRCGRRLLIPREALEAWLRGENAGGAT